jgi:hypothetical protein
MTRAPIAAALLAGLLALSAAADVRAAPRWPGALPYGLEWGMSLEQVLRSGIRLEYGELQPRFGHEYLAFDLPQWLGDEGHVFLYFGYDDRLWRIAVHSKGYSDDGTGTALFARYDELKAMLAEAFGPGEEVRELHHSAVSEPKRTVGTIQIGASWVFTEYQAGTEHVQLGLRARNLWTGYIALYIKNLEMEPKVLADSEAYKEALAAGEEDPSPAPHLALER